MFNIIFCNYVLREKKENIENNILNYAVIQITIQLRTLRKLLYFAIIIYLVRE